MLQLSKTHQERKKKTKQKIVKQIFQRVPEIPPMFSLLGQHVYSMVFSQAGVNPRINSSPDLKNVTEWSRFSLETKHLGQKSPCLHTAASKSDTHIYWERYRAHLCITQTQQQCSAVPWQNPGSPFVPWLKGCISLWEVIPLKTRLLHCSALGLWHHSFSSASTEPTKIRWDKEWEPGLPTQLFLTCSPLPPCKHT